MDQDAPRVQPDDITISSASDHHAPSKAANVLAKVIGRSAAQETLPTDRVAFEKQMQYLLAYAAASEKGARGVTNEEVAGLVKMQASTVSLANAFFVKCGFLHRTSPGYMPSKEVLEYHLATGWSDSNAGHKLAPLVTKTWFAQALRPKLEMRSIEETEAIGDLAQKAVVTKEYGPQLRTLIDYIVFSGIARREGSNLVLNRTVEPSMNEPRQESVAPPRQPSAPLSGLSGGRGGIQFAVNIDVDMAEIATWRPERITAFFQGLAMVVAAKKGDDEPRAGLFSD